ncbi:HAD family hydrolase [Subtercola lobariae]|uniref:HAD family hydrolase n=1 Tax=Subtercola lobariae TaxID=1588641 RepID=A0A917BC56_9MICO|nr:HAD family hydrolase [Subtercola lobariae]GGF35359.1 hypothetical protein GCM10011399_30490 [Subtercola lobariae]
MASSYTQVLVLDFDGTVCLGDAPVFAYARLLDEALVAREATSSGRPSVRESVERFLTRAERGSGEAAGPSSEPKMGGAAETSETPGQHDAPALNDALEVIANSVDGYEAAERLARSRGITDEQLSVAYTGSREELASGSLETTAPDGLADLLGGLPERTQIVLVTNAPEAGVTQQLRTLGLAECFDEVVTSARKPAGMSGIIERLLAQNGLAEHPDRLLSVGDIWRNDLAPAAAFGCATALIERLEAPDARPTYRAPRIELLYPDIEAWARAAG